jgi:hypothetical protein
MPISGIVVRLRSAASVAAVRARLADSAGITLGEQRDAALAAVVDAPDYAAHDLVLLTLRDTPDVCAVDIVFHDFSDVHEFPRLPARQRNTR